MRFFVIITLALALMAACNSGTGSKNLMEEAADTYADSHELAQYIVENLPTLGKELGYLDTRISNTDTLWVIQIVEIYDQKERIEREYSQWAKEFNMTGDPIQYRDSNDPNFTPERVLNKQKELYNRIFTLKVDLDAGTQMAADLRRSVES